MPVPSPSPRGPLPIRDGLGPSRVVLPPDGGWVTILDYLVDRFPRDAGRLREKVAAGEIVSTDGQPITAGTPFRPRGFVFLYRDPPPEVPVPFELDVLHRDDHLLVVDKPHFLATTPRGGHVVESALVRLRREFDVPNISPAHRLDRLTAGVLVFVLEPGDRRAYQELFAQRQVDKSYEALAPYDPELTLPRQVRSRIVKRPGHLQAQEVPGAPNAVTDIEVADITGPIGRYALRPHTGKTHQLRVHLNSLGIPIFGDPLYPTVHESTPGDYRDPLRLLARRIAFDDPLTGERREFVSRRELDPPTITR